MLQLWHNWNLARRCGRLQLIRFLLLLLLQEKNMMLLLFVWRGQEWLVAVYLSARRMPQRLCGLMLMILWMLLHPKGLLVVVARMILLLMMIKVTAVVSSPLHLHRTTKKKRSNKWLIIILIHHCSLTNTFACHHSHHRAW